MMTHLFMTLITAFIVSFVTVLLPNPSTLAASRMAMKDGLRSAEFFLAAVLGLDLVVFLVLVFGFHPLMRAVGVAEYLRPVAGLGLLALGIYMMASSRRDAGEDREIPVPRAQIRHRPFVAGVLVPAANPGYWIWWTTVGTAFIHSVRASGPLALVALMIAMIGGAAAWYFLLLRALAHGRKVFGPTSRGRIFFIMGLVMAAFGILLLLQAAGLVP